MAARLVAETPGPGRPRVGQGEKITPSLVSYYLAKGVPPYSAAYDLTPPKTVIERRDRPKPSGGSVTPLFRAPR
jgi:hypothetical protein